MERKINNPYSCKATSLEIKDIDNKQRIVKGYFSAFGIKDSDNDILVNGCFSKSINERGCESNGNRKIAHLRNHSWSEQIGKLLELKEDTYGLYFVSKLGRSTKGNDALLDYEDGILREHSIGFKYVKDKIKYVEAEDTYYVYELQLFEGSAVTFGSNENTPVLEVVKSLGVENAICQLNSKMEVLTNALRHGAGSDERLFEIEMEMKYLLSQYKSLEQLEPLNINTFKLEPKIKNDEAKKFMLNLIK
jgi:uncharacterized protein